jgi:hypothetical protein
VIFLSGFSKSYCTAGGFDQKYVWEGWFGIVVLGWFGFFPPSLVGFGGQWVFWYWGRVYLPFVIV